MVAHVHIGNRLEVTGVSLALRGDLRAACTHTNPDFHRKQAMGLYVGGTPRKIATWRETTGHDGISLPRGAMTALRTAASAHGERLVIHDQRISVPVEWPAFVAAPGGDATDRKYQADAEEACVQREQGIVRSPTGSGKTYMTLSTFKRIGQRALVIVRDRQLLEQWASEAQKQLGMRVGHELGVVRGGRKRQVGSCLTLALQQTLWSSKFPLAEFAAEFGCVAVDEVHQSAAVTVSSTIDAFAARYRFGFSADETRKDKKEFLIYDLFGDVIYEITRAEVEDLGFTCPVIVRLVPTRFEAEWYRTAPPAERDFKRLVDEMVANDDRNALIRHVVLVMVRERQDIPALVFTHRRAHGQQLSQDLLAADGITCGLMMGGDESSAAFAEARALIERGKLPVAIGTFNALGTGINLPNVRAGVVGTPFGNNRQFFNQVRGRLCRPAKGKTVGHLYYLWDRAVFPFAPRNLHDWNDGRVEMLDRDTAEWVSVDERGEPL